MPRTPEDLRNQLDEQIQFLMSSAAEYDAGRTAEAKRLATTVSTIVNTNNRRTSIGVLTQMGVRDEIQFISYAVPLEFRFPKLCLVMMQACSESGVSFIPLCSSQFRKYEPHRLVSFGEWWTGEPIYEVALSDGTIGRINRSDLCRYLRSKDGGSHVDEDLDDETYERLSRIAETGVQGVHVAGQAAGIVVGGTDQGEPVLDGHLAAMRHIAWELEHSLIAAGLVQPAPLPGSSV